MTQAKPLLSHPFSQAELAFGFSFGQPAASDTAI
jgi:hypothetical protein